MTLTNDLVLIFHLAQLLLSFVGLLWLMLGLRNVIDSSYLFYHRILRVYLPSCFLSYTAVVIGILVSRSQHESILFYAILLCAETLIIEKLIVYAIRYRRRFVLYDQIMDSVMRKADETLAEMSTKKDRPPEQSQEPTPNGEDSTDYPSDEQSQ